MRTFGVEEELLLVDAATGYPLALADQVTRRETVATGAPAAAAVNGLGPGHPAARPGDEDDETPGPELQREQVETGTAPCSSLDELAGQLTERRAVAARAARQTGAEVAALATSPLPVQPSVTLDQRYITMAEQYAMTAQEQLTCGCHVHVSVASDDEGVAVLDRIRPWLPPLLALSANSPFWQGRDSGYASYRRQVWGRWPSAGTTELFGTARAYHETVDAMLATGTLVDEGMVYFDARLSRNYPTVEIRVADVCLEAGDAVLLASLSRALVETAARDWRRGAPPPPVRTEVLRLAGWRASRSGLDGELVHPVTGRAAPAEAVIRALAGHVGPALADFGGGQADATADLLEALLARGNGAARQRRVHEATGDLSEVVRTAVARTLSVG
ncbi:MAG TPA: glutamate--cysteine ligase [Streptosporangiaceae bacterium]|jgi:carboxylate-amine ligase